MSTPPSIPMSPGDAPGKPAAEFRGRRRGGVFWFVLAALAAGAAVLFLFNPADHAFYPQCFFRKLTGLDCPGCGGLRALHQVLHGNFSRAFALNPLVILLGPAVLAFAGAAWWRSRTGRDLIPLRRRAPWGWLLAGAVIVFWILRNLSVISPASHS